jgi:hypothetical protein
VKVLLDGVELEVASDARKQGKLDAPYAAFAYWSCISGRLSVRVRSITG